jgi:hypothetical protein
MDDVFSLPNGSLVVAYCIMLAQLTTRHDMTRIVVWSGEIICHWNRSTLFFCGLYQQSLSLCDKHSQ